MLPEHATDMEEEGVAQVVDSLVVVAGLILAAALIVISALLSLGRRATFQRELAAVRSGKYLAWQGYARYRNSARRAVRARTSIFLVVLIIILVASLVLPQTSFGVSGFLALITTSANIALLLVCFLTGLVLALVISSILVAVLADAPAYRVLHGGTLRTRDLVTRRLKVHASVRIPLMLWCDGCAVLFAVGVSWWVCLALAFAMYATANVVALRLLVPLQRWLYPHVPLEQSRWAALAPRVEAWAQLAGLPVPHVYVRSGPVEGFGNSAALGGSPGMLLLTDEFLANSEWRQQDALLCWLLVAREPLMRQAARIVAFGICTMLVMVGLIAAVALSFSSPTGDLASSLVLTFLPILVVIALLVVLSTFARRINRRAKQILRAADRRAAELTGDPWAVMAMLATMDTLCLGIPAISGYALGPVPPRLAELEALTHAPGPRAPWAYQPVPSLQPVLASAYPITVPLNSQGSGQAVPAVAPSHETH